MIKDSEGIIGQPKHGFPDGVEGGDSLNWQAHYLYFSKEIPFRNKLCAANWYNLQFESKDHKGLYVRHPNPKASKFGFASYCEGNWRGVESRDQMTGKLCFFAKAKAKRALWRSFREHCKRGLIFANNTIHNGDNPSDYDKTKWSGYAKRHKLPDLTLFDIWAIYIRGFRAWYLYPLLPLLDLHLLAGAIIVALKNNNDIISFIIKIILSREVVPTPISWVASKILSKKNIKIRLLSYWGGWRKQPDMYKIYIPLIEKYLR